MEDEMVAREQLVEELARLRERITALEDWEREREQMEVALRESEERYRNIINKANFAFFHSTPDGRFTAANSALARMLGYESPEDLVSSVTDMASQVSVDPKHREAFMRRLEEKGALLGFEAPLKRKDGGTIWIWGDVLSVRGPKGETLYYEGVMTDITERKRVEEALRESEEKYRNIFNNANFAIYQTTPEGRHITANCALARMLGYESPEELTSSVTDIGRQVYVDPGSREELKRLLGEKGAVSGFEARLCRKDGSAIWTWGEVRAVTNDEGETLYYEGVMSDITEGKILRDELLQAQKMEAVGQLAGGLAHDINNMLTLILGFCERAAKRISAGHPARSDLQEVQNAAKRVSTLTRPLLAFSRRQVTKPVIVDLNHLMLSTAKMLERLIGEDIELVCLPAPDLHMVKVDPGQIEQVLINMAVNARDAMPGGGKLTIGTANVTLTSHSAPKLPNLPPGPYARLSLTDTGAGMNEDVKSHVFEPFFTTKGPGRGTGLGLATCYGIVKQSRGDIRFESELGQGTTFEIYLPKADEEAVPPIEANEPTTQPTGTETVLVVEDEPSVRRLLVKILGRLGYTVLQATDGMSALQVAQRHEEERIQLLLTDVVMPHMGGKDLADRLRAWFPGMKVLFMSGYMDESIQQWASEESASFIGKPFTTSAVARKVRDALDGIDPGQPR